MQYCLSAEKRIISSTGIGILIQYWNKKMGRLSKELPSVDANVMELRQQW
jgi:hypothetical protein